MLIALSVVAIVVGKPLSYLNCQVVGTSSVAESASQLSSQVKDTFNKQGGKVVYSNWIGASKTTCYEMKAVWGLSIALWYVPLTLSSPIIISNRSQHPFRLLRHVQRMPLAS